MTRTTMEGKPKGEREARERLHQLVDRLPGTELTAAERFLEFVDAKSDPVMRALMGAPEGEEELNKEDEAALQEAREELDRGGAISNEEMRREFS